MLYFEYGTEIKTKGAGFRTAKVRDGRGGRRAGAGRPPGQGRYREPTVAMRVPVSQAAKVAEACASGLFKIPLYSSKVAAGFPSPAEDAIDSRLDVNDLVVDNPNATFFLQVSGDSMRDAGIVDGDYIVVDRSAKARHNSIVVAAIDGEFTVKHLLLSGRRPVLRAANPDYRDIEPAEEEDLKLFGVVRGVVRRIEG